MDQSADEALIRELTEKGELIRQRADARAAELEAEAERLRAEADERHKLAAQYRDASEVGLHIDGVMRTINRDHRHTENQSLAEELATQAEEVREQAKQRASDLSNEARRMDEAAYELEKIAKQLRETAKPGRPEPQPPRIYRGREDSMDPDADFSDPGKWDLWET